MFSFQIKFFFSSLFEGLACTLHTLNNDAFSQSKQSNTEVLLLEYIFSAKNSEGFNFQAWDILPYANSTNRTRGRPLGGRSFLHVCGLC